MDVKKVLERVGMGGADLPPTLKSLNDICVAFVSNIPFETLDMFGGKRKVWDLAIIYENIVEKKRGGFCCDTNILLHHVLKELGYKVDLVKAYAYAGGKYLKVADHMVQMVHLQDGGKYLTDVGWGGSSFVFPLKMEVRLEQKQPNGIYRLRKTDTFYIVEKKKQTTLKTEDDRVKFNNEQEKVVATTADGNFSDEWNILFRFEDAPLQFDDFQEGHDHAQFENEYLLTNAYAVIQNEKGRKFFVNNLYTVKEYVSSDVTAVVEFKNCTIDEMYPILEKEFGIRLDFELKLKKLQ